MPLPLTPAPHHLVLRAGSQLSGATSEPRSSPRRPPSRAAKLPPEGGSRLGGHFAAQRVRFPRGQRARCYGRRPRRPRLAAMGRRAAGGAAARRDGRSRTSGSLPASTRSGTHMKKAWRSADFIGRRSSHSFRLEWRRGHIRAEIAGERTNAVDETESDSPARRRQELVRTNRVRTHREQGVDHPM